MIEELKGAIRPIAIDSIESMSQMRSPLRYPGGKQKAIEQIATMLPPAAEEYREPLLGGGSVFIHARKIGFAKRYWINDRFQELISFWRTIQNAECCGQLIADLEQLRSRFGSADEIKTYFEAVRREKAVDEYREALLFFFFNRVTFSGTTKAGGFSSAASLRRFTASSIERLRMMPQVLSGVKITNVDCDQVIQTPGKDVFVFLDPPYYTATRLYGANGSLHAFDHERLADTLRNSEHRFLITYDDCEEIRQLYSWANVTNWQLRYGMNNCSRLRQSKLGSELFIRNY